MAEVAEHQRDEQRAARCGEREEVEELHRAKQNAKHGGDGEGREAEIVKFQQLALEFGDVACLYVRNFSALLVQIRVDDARHQLHEQHNADDAEQIRNAVADRDRVLILGCNSLFGCRERRSRGQTAREQAGDHSRKLVRVVARLPGFNRTADEQTQNCRNAAGKNDHDAEQHIGLEVVLHVLEEVRARDKADRGHEEHKAQIFDDLQRLRGVVDLFNDKFGIEVRSGERAVNQRDHENACRAEADALDGDAPEQIPDCRDSEYGKHQKIRGIDGCTHLFSPLFHLIFLRDGSFWRSPAAAAEKGGDPSHRPAAFRPQMRPRGPASACRRIRTSPSRRRADPRCGQKR